MTGLEERGLRPDPRYRGHLAACIHRQLDREMRNLRVYIAHEIMWGTPCGPTESMLPGHGPRGIVAVVTNVTQILTKP